MNLRILILLLTIITLLISSCEEQNDVFFEPDAKLIWTGKYDNGGCGFYLEIDSALYKPENEGIISLRLRSDEPLDVSIQYIDLLYDLDYTCGDTLREVKTRAIRLQALDLNEELP